MQIKHIFITRFALSLVRVRILGTRNRPHIKYIILCINLLFLNVTKGDSELHGNRLFFFFSVYR